MHARAWHTGPGCVRIVARRHPPVAIGVTAAVANSLWRVWAHAVDGVPVCLHHLRCRPRLYVRAIVVAALLAQAREVHGEEADEQE